MIRPLSNSDCPPENGLCLDHAFMGEPRIAIREAFGIGIRLKKFPDVHFSISTTKKDRWVESDALEPRLLQAERDAIRAGHGDWYARIRTLRRGKRSLGNWKGFEVLAFKPRQAGEGTAHEFVFVSQGEPNNPLLPVLEIEMHTGVGQNRTGTVLPSLSDAEAVLLWDAVTKSIRSNEAAESAQITGVMQKPPEGASRAPAGALAVKLNRVADHAAGALETLDRGRCATGVTADPKAKVAQPSLPAQIRHMSVDQCSLGASATDGKARIWGRKPMAGLRICRPLS
eukprot:gene30171-37340_t